MTTGNSEQTKKWGLLVVGHGSVTHAAAVASISDHAERLRESGRFADVSYAVLNGGPTVDEALRGLDGERVMVVPFFMSQGYFVQEALPPLIAADERAVIAPAIGNSPRLGPALDCIAMALADEAGWSPGDCDLLVIGHGSDSDAASKRATEAQAGRVGQAFASVKTAFLEEPPLIADVLAVAERPTVCLGYFAAPGSHAAVDVPGALAEASVETRYSGAIGAHPIVREVLLDHILDSLAA